MSKIDGINNKYGKRKWSQCFLIFFSDDIFLEND